MNHLIAKLEPDSSWCTRPKKRPVIVYFNGTFMNRENGAHARVFALLDFLQSESVEVIVYSYGDHPDCPWTSREIAMFRARYPSTELVIDVRPRGFKSFIRAKKLASEIRPASTGAIVRCRIPYATPNYQSLIARHPDAILIVNYALGLLELNGVDAKDKIIETHDIGFLQFSKRFGHALHSARIGRKCRSELALLEHASALVAIASPESGLFRLCFPEKPVFFVPDYETPSNVEAATHGNAIEYDMAFIGSENPFNVDGLGRFIREHGESVEWPHTGNSR